MISRWLPLSLFIIVVAPGLLYAQQPPPKRYIVDLRADARDANFEKMYEDIEIFRRILGRELQPLYPRVSYPNVISNPFTSTYKVPNPTTVLDSANQRYLFFSEPNTYILASPPSKEEILFSLEGVYLKGQGVIYTATVSSLQPPAKASSAHSVRWRVTVNQPDSDWESIRRQIRNEKEQPKKSETSKPATLSDVLLKLLAENGHNFSQLDGNEFLTLVLTVHEASSSSAAPKPGAGPAKREFQFRPSNNLSEIRQQVRDLELLGELHLKQGKSEEAIAVFHRLLEQTNNPKQQAELLRKLAQCYLMQGQDEKARAELDQAIALLKKDSEVKDKPLPAAKPAAALPGKLIIAVLKRQLDEVKQGKITFEEFRRQSSVQTLRFEERRPRE